MALAFTELPARRLRFDSCKELFQFDSVPRRRGALSIEGNHVFFDFSSMLLIHSEFFDFGVAERYRFDATKFIIGLLSHQVQCPGAVLTAAPRKQNSFP